MTEYTPTTEEVRSEYIGKGFVDSEFKEYTQFALDQIGGEFDRWLAEVERTAVVRERAAIRSTIGAYTEHGVWAFDQAVGCIDRERRKTSDSCAD